MLETKTIARPYTNAIFEIATGKGQLEEWEKFINLFSKVVENPNFKSVELAAMTDGFDLSDFLIDFIGEIYKGLSLEQKNFVRLVVENKRINIVSSVKILFEQLVREANDLIIAHVFTRFPLSDEQKQLIQRKLTTKFGKKCELKVLTDSSVIGGVIIKIGDSVIDLSIEGRLKAFAKAMV
ncbi:MAG: hypothetical protein CML36_01310 [Rhodobacteraceae bacterium]|nr:hypothetical protein [Paracoccaceae bacterium]|tara:strand:+ start:1557 stop:2099 length:543 start_codon:yes stop_codon:yes gene_type:complete